MMNYNYLEAMTEDIKDYIKNDAELDANVLLYNRSDLEEKLHDDLWTEDSVTGNASGSYTFNRSEAKEYVLDNIDLCKEALSEFCVDAETIGNKFLDEEWEYLDVIIRCYILGCVISELLEDAEDDFNAWLDSREE